MENDSWSIRTLNDLLDHNVRKFAVTEMQMKSVLSGWINKAENIRLKNVLQRYLDYVQQNKEGLDAFIEEEKLSSLNLLNKVMNAFIEDTELKLTKCTDPEVKDACLLASVQSINHFKISLYGTAAAFAKAMGKEKAAMLFHQAEMNEKQIDESLSQLAEQEINEKAKILATLPA